MASREIEDGQENENIESVYKPRRSRTIFFVLRDHETKSFKQVSMRFSMLIGTSTTSLECADGLSAQICQDNVNAVDLRTDPNRGSVRKKINFEIDV